MDVTGISPREAASAPLRRDRVPAAPAPLVEGTARAKDDAGPGEAPTRSEPTEPAATTVRVEVDVPPGGVRTVTVFDVRTGQPVFQLPPEQVVRVIDSALKRAEEGKHRGE
ncbi:MAG: hypothetical protein M3P96_05575 [Actinomycetota bacterium]|nr:hypothetical protein [Actinomycetota bacterium]